MLVEGPSEVKTTCTPHWHSAWAGAQLCRLEELVWHLWSFFQTLPATAVTKMSAHLV